MQYSNVLTIIGLYRKIDEIARDVYKKLSSLSDDPKLSRFWLRIAGEEAGHIEFWKQAQQVKELDDLPDFFESPRAVIHELEHSVTCSESLLRHCQESFSTGRAFTLAYRIEFYLMHPTFAMLFHILGPVIGNMNPEKLYEKHIENFIDMLRKRGSVTPELELLSETLHRLWRENKKLASLSSRDELTGLLNRRGFFAIAIQLAHLAQQKSSTVGVIIADLDHFKKINDLYGHTSGDRVLEEVAEKFTQTFRASDLVGRYGGEEFIVFLPDVAEGTTGQIAEKFRRLVESSSTADIPVTISIGYDEGLLDRDVENALHQMIDHADIALYEAKKQGRNKVVGFKPGFLQ